MAVVPIKLKVIFLFLVALLPRQFANSQSLGEVIRTTQEKVVKIYGAGGVRGMEAYQSGILISPDGYVLTALGYVLDTDDLAVVLDDGRKWTAEFVGSDPISELAVLKLPIDGPPLPYFDLHRQTDPEVGTRVLAVSNLFGIAAGNEPVSVLQGVVTAIAPLDARRGAFRSNYRGTVYVVDAYTNNPGAAGGALTNWRGELLGILGKELRSRVTGTWLNYALPTGEINATVGDIIAGRAIRSADTTAAQPEKPLTTGVLGFALVPNLLLRTPPFVDAVRRNSPADHAGMRADDLVVFVNGEPTASCRAVLEAIERRESDEPVQLSVLRDGHLLQFTLKAEDEQ